MNRSGFRLLAWGFTSENAHTALEAVQQEKQGCLCPKFLHVCTCSGGTARSTIRTICFGCGWWAGRPLRPSVWMTSVESLQPWSPVPDTTGLLLALHAVGKTNGGRLWHFPLLRFPLIEKAECSWVSSQALPTSVLRKSWAGHAISWHSGLGGLFWFLTLHLLPLWFSECGVPSFHRYPFKQAVVPHSGAISAGTESSKVR